MGDYHFRFRRFGVTLNRNLALDRPYVKPVDYPYRNSVSVSCDSLTVVLFFVSPVRPQLHLLWYTVQNPYLAGMYRSSSELMSR